MDSSLKSPHLTEWNLHAGYSSWLSEMLRSPEGKLFMLVLEEMAQPDTVDEDLDRIAPGANLLESMAFRHLLCSGQKMARTNIRTLASLNLPETEISPEWTYEEPQDTK